MGKGDDANAHTDERELSQGFHRFRAAMQAGDEIRHCNIEQARSGDRKHGRQGKLHIAQGKITGEPTDQGGDAGGHIERESAAPGITRVQQDCEVAHLLRDRMRNDGQRCRDTQRLVGEKGSRDDNAVADVVHAIADQNHQAGTSVVAHRFVCAGVTRRTFT